jgi:hypothetical protein
VDGFEEFGGLGAPDEGDEEDDEEDELLETPAWFRKEPVLTTEKKMAKRDDGESLADDEAPKAKKMEGNAIKATTGSQSTK